MPTHRLRAFTLVEMLVVISIIAVLAALLLPAVNKVLVAGRNTAIGVEVNQLASAIEAYKQDKGDYPPNFRDPAVVTRHIRKCYPKIDQTYFTSFMSIVFPTGGTTRRTGTTTTMPIIDESETLVFWLSGTDTDPRYPFLRYFPSGTLTASPKKYYDFDESRLMRTVSADIPSYTAKYCKDSFYIYIDSRSYDNPASDDTDVCRFTAIDGSSSVNTYAFADDTATGVRPYWSSTASGTTSTVNRTAYKPMNPTTFQIICAGQDGDFGTNLTADVDVKIAIGNLAGTNYSIEDNDNITNFSNGKTLKENIP
jgi:prepilin-type N-terminal cleavage/methylation domain-containing protein